MMCVGVPSLCIPVFSKRTSIHPSQLHAVVVVMPGLVKCLIPMFCYHVKAAETVLTCILTDFCISVLSICVLFVRFVNIYNENPK